MSSRTAKLAISGMLAAVAALASGEFFAALFAPRPSPVVAVANRVVDNAPIWLVEFGKNRFGLADKPAVLAGTFFLSMFIGAVLGVYAARKFSYGIRGISVFGFISVVAISLDAQAGFIFACLCSLVSVLTGVFVLRQLVYRVVSEDQESGADMIATEPPEGSSIDARHVIGKNILHRRGFIAWAGFVGVAATTVALGAKKLRTNASVAAAREEVVLPSTDDSDLKESISLGDSDDVAAVQNISPLIVPNDDFYLIDTALVTPQVDPANWSLKIKGMVDNELIFTYDELLERSTTVAPVTLSCVSNEIGGNLVGNAIWQGVPLQELLEEAGVNSAASQIASRSIDGWTCGFPTEVISDGRTALVAVGMNGEPLPIEHGFPARLVVSGLYGYVSATKWLTEIELTTWDGFDGYWVPRGWSKEGPVKTQSRIDTPRNQSTISAGKVAIAGVAWAPNTGIDSVEVRVDNGDWQMAILGESLGADAWRQWMLPWQATGGDHLIQVRAVDDSGETQTQDLASPRPDGATGWHSIAVRVS